MLLQFFTQTLDKPWPCVTITPWHVTFYRTAGYQEICLIWNFVCCTDRISFRASLFSLFPFKSVVRLLTTASLCYSAIRGRKSNWKPRRSPSCHLVIFIQTLDKPWPCVTITPWHVTFYRTVGYQEICLSWNFVCCTDRISFRASLFSLFPFKSLVRLLNTASLCYSAIRGRKSNWKPWRSPSCHHMMTRWWTAWSSYDDKMANGVVSNCFSSHILPSNRDLPWWEVGQGIWMETGRREMNGNWFDLCSVQNSNSSRFPDSQQFCRRLRVMA